MGKIKFFCIPYAGGSEAVYNDFMSYADTSIEIVPIALAGRGKRFRAGLYKDFGHAVDDIYDLIKGQIEDCDNYALFGHSMGCWLAFELAHKLIQNGNKAPCHIFFSGRYPPHIEKEGGGIERMTDAELKAEIISLDGVPEELHDNDFFWEFFLKVIRSDLTILDRYMYKEKGSKIACDISALWGISDPETKEEEMNEWTAHTAMQANIFSFDGGHFFIKERAKEVMDVVNNLLLRGRHK